MLASERVQFDDLVRTVAQQRTELIEIRARLQIFEAAFLDKQEHVRQEREQNDRWRAEQARTAAKAQGRV